MLAYPTLKRVLQLDVKKEPVDVGALLRASCVPGMSLRTLLEELLASSQANQLPQPHNNVGLSSDHDQYADVKPPGPQSYTQVQMTQLSSEAGHEALHVILASRQGMQEEIAGNVSLADASHAANAHAADAVTKGPPFPNNDQVF